MQLDERIRQIQEDETHGAAYLAREALRTLIQCVESPAGRRREQLRDEYLEVAVRLLAIRPSMPAIGHTVVRATELAQAAYRTELDADSLRSKIVAELNALLARMRKAHEEAVSHAAAFLPPSATVLTISLSSNVQDALLRARQNLKRVFVAEARPRNEGQQLAAILAQGGIPVTLITDAAMGQALDRVDLCLVGADGVLQDGSLINKAGSYLMALAARERKVPFYSICETFKYHVGAVPFEVEQKSPQEVCAPIAGVEISNCYFDVVPARLVKGYVTELGVLSPHLVREQIRHWQRQMAGKSLFDEW